MAPASEIMHPACDQIDGRPAAGIKVRDIFLFVRIDSDQDTLLFCLSLKNALPVRKENAPEIPVAQGIGSCFGSAHFADQISQRIPFRFFKTGPQGLISVLFNLAYLISSGLPDLSHTG